MSCTTSCSALTTSPTSRACSSRTCSTCSRGGIHQTSSRSSGPGLIPVWKGEGPGRPYELGESIGRASRELVALSEPKALERLTKQHSLDEQAAQNLLTFLNDQQKATGAVPSDRTVVVERFRDEIGDWRVCILTPFGARVHAPW